MMFKKILQTILHSLVLSSIALSFAYALDKENMATITHNAPSVMQLITPFESANQHYSIIQNAYVVKKDNTQLPAQNSTTGVATTIATQPTNTIAQTISDYNLWSKDMGNTTIVIPDNNISINAMHTISNNTLDYTVGYNHRTHNPVIINGDIIITLVNNADIDAIIQQYNLHLKKHFTNLNTAIVIRKNSKTDIQAVLQTLQQDNKIQKVMLDILEYPTSVN